MLAKQYEHIPAVYVNEFLNRVVNAYMNRFNADTLIADNEFLEDGELQESFHRFVSITIFEDEYHYTRIEEDTADEWKFQNFSEDYYDPFIQEINKALNHYHMPYYADYKGTYHNLPTVEVW